MDGNFSVVPVFCEACSLSELAGYAHTHAPLRPPHLPTSAGVSSKYVGAVSDTRIIIYDTYDNIILYYNVVLKYVVLSYIVIIIVLLFFSLYRTVE